MNEILAGREAAAGGLTALRRFAVPPSSVRRSSAKDETAEKCELCGEQLGPEHSHLVDLRQRSIGCACRPCALLFDRPGARYRTVPDRVRTDPGSPLTDAEWTQLAIPVGIAFFFVNSDLGRVVASYPSPAGVTECELDLAAWDRLCETHPLLREPEPDVEAILVVAGGAPGAAADVARAAAEAASADETAGADETASTNGTSSTGETADTAETRGADETRGGIDTFLVPIDVCYSLAGALRMDWHGFDGGPEVRKVLTDLLTGLRRRARPLPAPE